MSKTTVTPLVVRKEPGDPEFHEYLDQARDLARTLQVGTELIYTGPDDHKFSDWSPIPHGARVTVVGHIPCKSAVTCQFPDGTRIGLNIYDLAWPEPQGRCKMDYNVIPLGIDKYSDLDDFDEHEAKEAGWPSSLISAVIHEIYRRELEPNTSSITEV